MCHCECAGWECEITGGYYLHLAATRGRRGAATATDVLLTCYCCCLSADWLTADWCN